MKRSPIGRGTKPPKRTTPLRAQGTPLTRTARITPKPRTSSPRKVRPAPRHTGPSVDTKAVVDVRDGGLCVRCKAPANNRDHRRGRGAGGTKGDMSDRINGAGWLLTLCGSGNAGDGCHRDKDHDREQFERDGYAIPRNGLFVDAELVPVRTPWSHTGWALFTNDGARTPCAPPPDNDARNLWREAA